MFKLFVIVILNVIKLLFVLTWTYMFSFWCVVSIALLTSRTSTPHQNSYIYVHIKTITYKYPNITVMYKMFSKVYETKNGCFDFALFTTKMECSDTLRSERVLPMYSLHTLYCATA